MDSEQLKNLLLLARSKSNESRTQLVENITDLFLTEGGRLSEHERALMSDILGKLIKQVETDIRRSLADSLLRSGVDLPDIATLLANDEIEVARPLLEQSTLLQDPELIEVIRMRTDEHRLAISMREKLSETVSNALIEYGSEDVIETLLNNHDAQISKRAMEYLVMESRRVDRFQEPLVMRSDLPGELAYRMHWWVSAALRKRILTEFDVDPVKVDMAIKLATASATVEQDSEQSIYVRAQRLVRRMSENGELSIQFLISSLRQQRVAVFVAGLAELANITFMTAWRIFSDKGGESMAILARSIDMDRSQFTTIFLLIAEAREGSGPKSPRVLKEILNLYDTISQANARGALQVWQRDSAYQNAIEELEKSA